MEWSQEKILMLIYLVHERPLIWDSLNPKYRDTNARHLAFCEISGAVGYERPEVERKWRNISSHFAREIRKELESRKPGKGPPYDSRWFAYNPLQFLRNRNSPRKSLEATRNNSVESIIPAAHGNVIKKRKTVEMVNKPLLPPPIVGLATDEQIFGDYVASYLRCLRTERSKKKFKRIVQQAMIDVQDEEDALLDHEDSLVYEESSHDEEASISDRVYVISVDNEQDLVEGKFQKETPSSDKMERNST